jgi:hypothetical protein
MNYYEVYYCSLFDELHLVLPISKHLCGTFMDNELIEFSLSRNNWYYTGAF